jgi:site-specific recombinase XerD
MRKTEWTMAAEAHPPTELERRIARWGAALAERGVDPKTVGARAVVIRTLRRTGVEPGIATTDQLEYFLSAELSAQTRKQHRAALNSWYRYLATEGLRSDNPTRLLPREPRLPRRNTELERHIARFELEMVERGMKRSTIIFDVGVVRRLDRSGIDPARATGGQLERYLTNGGWRRSTQAQYRTGLNSWYRFLLGHGLRTVNPLDNRHPGGVGVKLPDPPPAWSLAFEDWSSYMRSGGLAKTTLRLRVYQMQRFALALGATEPWTATTEDLLTWLGAQTWAPGTRRTYRAALRSFYMWATLTDRISSDPSRRLPTVREPGGVPHPVPEHVIQSAVTRADDRIRLAIVLAASCGLRRDEMARLHCDDIVGDSLLVHGKGLRDRVIPLTPRVMLAVAGGHGYLFPGNVDGHISANHLGRLVSRALGPSASAHMLRHRFASKVYAVDTDLRAVQTLLGHSKPETTARYTAVPDGALRRAVAGAAL